MKIVLDNLSYRSGKLEDGLKENQSILIDEEIIKDIFNSKENKYPEVKHVDCTGLFATPGLINMHVHLFGSGKPSKSLGKSKKQDFLMWLVKKTPIGPGIVGFLVRNAAKKELMGGVTTCRTVGDFVYSDVKLRNKINKRKFFGPNLIVSGPAITSSTGHGAGTFAYDSDDIEELKNYVRLNASKGVDFIKICTTGGVMDAKKKGEPGVVRMTLEQVKAVCDEAHKLGLIVASHTESPEGVEIDALAGVDSIEHGSIFDKKTEDLLVKNHSFMCATFTPALPLSTVDPKYTKLDEMARFNTNIVLENMTNGNKHCLEVGIPVALGTDASCPLCFQHLSFKEMTYASKKLELPLEKTLEMMTIGNAKILRMDDKIGSIEIGKAADINITKEDPVKNNNTYKEIEMVIHHNKILRRPRVNKYKVYTDLLENL